MVDSSSHSREPRGSSAAVGHNVELTEQIDPRELRGDMRGDKATLFGAETKVDVGNFDDVEAGREFHHDTIMKSVDFHQSFDVSKT